MKLRYDRLFTPILTDVSLRDGLQGANIKDYPLSRKKTILDNIVTYYTPAKIEVGSLIHTKVLPILADSMELYQYAKENHGMKNLDFFMLVPSLAKFDIAMKYNIPNIAVVTSVSEEFQKKNTNRSIQETKEDFKTMFTILSREHFYEKRYMKLYISCIHQCPIQGYIDEDKIINEIFYYHNNYRFNELCLSDTMGTLDSYEFEYIIKRLIYIGVPASKFSVHFHYLPSKQKNIENLLHICFKYNITKFDVAMIDTGGCSVTMDSSKLASNLSYDLFYDVYNRYILEGT
jgi:hydroxymethylglutaryl-CoA lyase